MYSFSAFYNEHSFKEALQALNIVRFWSINRFKKIVFD